MELAMFPVMYEKYPPDRWLKTAREYFDAFGIEPPMVQPEEWANFPLKTAPDTTHDPVVYFLQIGDHVKIGTTINKRQRFAAMLPPAAKFLLEIPGSYTLEHRLHARFAADRLEGEWFRLSEQIKDFIREKSATSRSRRSSTSTVARQQRSTGSPTPTDGAE